MPTVELSHEARRQFLALPPEIADQSKELPDRLKENPTAILRGAR